MRGTILLGLVFTLLPACDRTFDDASRRAVEQVLADQQAAWNRGDIEAFMDGYERSPDIVFTSGGKVRHGYDATLAAYKKRYAEGDKMGHLQFDVTQVRGLGANAAVVLGRFELTDTPHAGGGVFSLVLQRSNGTWRVVHDHTSADAIASPQ